MREPADLVVKSPHQRLRAGSDVCSQILPGAPEQRTAILGNLGDLGKNVPFHKESVPEKIHGLHMCQFWWGVNKISWCNLLKGYIKGGLTSCQLVRCNLWKNMVETHHSDFWKIPNIKGTATQVIEISSQGEGSFLIAIPLTAFQY